MESLFARSHYVALARLASLELRGLPVTVSQVSVLKACATMAGYLRRFVAVTVD